MSNDDREGRSRSTGRAARTFHEGERALLRKRIVKRIRRISFSKVTGRIRERTRQLVTAVRTPHPTKSKTPVFVVGCNRSGTNMVCRAIGKSPHGWDYREADFSLAFRGYYLRSDPVIESLIRRTPAPIISFGSILDSQSADDLLSRFDGAKAIWIYRGFEDVANSCARMQWGPQLKEYVGWVAGDELEKLGARGERIGKDTVRLVKDSFREDLSIEDSACLYWYMRNRLFFDLGLHTDQRALLMQYEDTVLESDKAFRRVFDFLDFPFHTEITEGIYSTSVGKHAWPGADPSIHAACSELERQLDEH
jgi:hypothetical protein